MSAYCIASEKIEFLLIINLFRLRVKFIRNRKTLVLAVEKIPQKKLPSIRKPSTRRLDVAFFSDRIKTTPFTKFGVWTLPLGPRPFSPYHRRRLSNKSETMGQYLGPV